MQVVFVLVDHFPEFALSCTIAALNLANEIAGKELYGWQLASANGRSALSASGRIAAVRHGLEPAPENGIVMVLSGAEVDANATHQHIEFLRHEDRRGVPIGAMCSGGYLLVRAGLMKRGRLALGADARDLVASMASEVTISDRGFLADGRYPTSADARASLDLMLWLIERRDGRTLARKIGERILARGVNNTAGAKVPYVTNGKELSNEYVRSALLKMRAAIDRPLHISELAEELGITTRQLQRLFRKHLQMQPKQALTQLRLARACELLVQTEMSVTAIALSSGFQSLAHFGRVFRNAFGHSPGRVRMGEVGPDVMQNTAALQLIR